MRLPALFLPALIAGAFAACTLPATPLSTAPAQTAPPAAATWGQPVESSASAPQPWRVQAEPAPQCVPEGGDCGPPQAQCCAGYTCAGLNRSICISKH